ncbi:hypothetical protein POVCU1_046340, partial [Plasmodium ovale curtisi]
LILAISRGYHVVMHLTQSNSENFASHTDLLPPIDIPFWQIFTSSRNNAEGKCGKGEVRERSEEAR